MELKKHKARHQLLHRELDELIGDFITHTHKPPSKTTLMELLQWSHSQTLNPSEEEK